MALRRCVVISVVLMAFLVGYRVCALRVSDVERGDQRASFGSALGHRDYD